MTKSGRKQTTGGERTMESEIRERRTAEGTLDGAYRERETSDRGTGMGGRGKGDSIGGRQGKERPGGGRSATLMLIFVPGSSEPHSR